MATARFVVLQMLMRMEQNAYSNLVLDQTLEESNLIPQDKKFASCLFYGVIERRLTLDYIVQYYSTKPIKKLNNEILQILRMGLYQLLYMSSVPESAAVNESVKLTRQIKMQSAGGFVNAVLRNFIRNGKKISFPENDLKRLSIEYSCPEWLIDKWNKEYGKSALKSILESTVNEQNEFSLRVNTTLISTEELLKILSEEGITAEQDALMKNCVHVINAGSPEKWKAYEKGYFHVQDISSQLCCQAVNPKNGETVLDLCAAPGGKTFTMAELMENQGNIYAFDLHQKRVDLINSGAERLKLTCITAKTGNAKEFNSEIPLADRILCDVPCAGLGVIGKKPEIKYKNPKELEKLPEIQYAILENAAKYLKPGGELVYSTCSLSLDENDKVIDRFLSEHKNFEGCNVLDKDTYKLTVFPDDYHGDGFFISKVRRMK